MSRKKQFVIITIISLVIAGATALPPLSHFFADHSVDLLFKVRGDRHASQDVLFLFIDAKDIAAMKGWPISRDYYGYLIYLLKKAGARTVVIDILFDTPHQRYIEYDETLVDFMGAAHNVILPFAVADSDFNKTKNSHAAVSLLWPIKPFRDAAAGMGFANLANESLVRRSPLMVRCQDTLMASLGLKAATHFLLGDSAQIKFARHSIRLQNGQEIITIRTDSRHQLYLNHFGDIQPFSLSMVDALQTLQSHPDSVNFKDKLIFLGVTAAGYAPQKMTPLHNTFPATLIHLTAAENIIENNYIRLTPSWVALLLTIGAGLAGFLLHRLPRKTVYLLLAPIAIFYLGTAYCLFRLIFMALSIYPPLIAFTVGTSLPFLFSTHQRLDSETTLRKLYQQQTEDKQLQLSQSEKSLRNLQIQLEKQHDLSHESQQLILEKEGEIQRLEQQLKDLQTAAVSFPSQVSTAFPHIIHADDSPLKPLLELAVKIGADDIPVLLTGETGVGKELFARAIHQSGKRAGRPFIAVNCGALAETLLESELFGHEKGAFTGAVSQRKGRFELANEGTLFLDEITETTSAFQAKLLRALQDGCFERLGGEKTIKTNVRILAASSRKILQQVHQGQFREDLFYRLNGFMLELPPLRERLSDIPLLAQHFLNKHGFDAIKSFSEQAMAVLTHYHWPGNVRELENSVRHAALLAGSDNRTMIQIIDLPENVRNSLQNQTFSFISLEEQILANLRSLKFSHTAIIQTAKTLGDKNRSTITEYLRGMVFKALVEHHYNLDASAKYLAASDEPEVIDKVRAKIQEYTGALVDMETLTAATFKGLPKKYHAYLNHVFERMKSQGPLS